MTIVAHRPNVLSIRFKVALLAVIAVVGICMTGWSGYQRERTQLMALERQAVRITWATSLSQLIHALQRERGASIWVTEIPTGDSPASLSALRAETDATLDRCAVTSASLEDSGFPKDLSQHLVDLRQKVDQHTGTGRESFIAYSAVIGDLLMHMEASQRTPDGFLRGLEATGELAQAREMMGQLRALMAFRFSQGALVPSTTANAAISRLALYSYHIAAYEHLADPIERAAIKATLEHPTHGRVIDFIEGRHRGGAPFTPQSWWQQATWLIDAFKGVEDAHNAAFVQRTLSEIESSQRHLWGYGVMISLVLALLVGYAVLVIARIMHALGGLISGSNEVIHKQNYSVRFGGEDYQDEFGKLSRSLNALLEVTDELLREKEKLAATDALTGVLNRRSFLNAAQREINRAKRYDSALSLVFMDIDHFKRVNDNWGHAAGDDVLKALVALIQQRVRGTDVLARWGGEEFILLATGVHGDDAALFAEKLRQAIESENFPAVGHMTCSLGVAEWQAAESFESLCARADTAVYAAKTAGRNRVCLAPELNTPTGEGFQ